MRMRSLTWSVTGLLLIGVVRGSAQDSVSVGEFQQINGFSGRKVVASGLVGGLLVGSLVDSYYAWWKGATKPFTFYTEGWFSGDHIGIDKTGHLFTSYFYFHTFRNIMLWGGFEPSTALWWAVGTSAFFALSIEIGDGVSDYGFDYQDLVFNFSGIGYGILQTQFPVLKNFNFKWSYVPRDGYRFPPHFTNHYDEHTYWLAVNVNGLLPAALEPYWPDVLQIAVGYGVDDGISKREGVIGLDFNLEVFPTHSEDLLLLQKTVNMFHIPAPAIKFTEKKVPRYYLFQRD